MTRTERIISQSEDAEKELVTRIARLRTRSTYSQRDMASLIGISPSTINRFETLASTPRLDTVIRILDAMGLRLAIVRKKTEETS